MSKVPGLKKKKGYKGGAPTTKNPLDEHVKMNPRSIGVTKLPWGGITRKKQPEKKGWRKLGREERYQQIIQFLRNS